MFHCDLQRTSGNISVRINIWPATPEIRAETHVELHVTCPLLCVVSANNWMRWYILQYRISVTPAQPFSSCFVRNEILPTSSPRASCANVKSMCQILMFLIKFFWWIFPSCSFIYIFPSIIYFMYVHYFVFIYSNDRL